MFVGDDGWEIKKEVTFVHDITSKLRSDVDRRLSSPEYLY